jgi:hypothetical protein
MFSYHFPDCAQFPPQASVRIARVAAIGETEDEQPNGTIRVYPVDGHLLDKAIYGNQAVEFMQGLKVMRQPDWRESTFRELAGKKVEEYYFLSFEPIPPFPHRIEAQSNPFDNHSLTAAIGNDIVQEYLRRSPVQDEYAHPHLHIHNGTFLLVPLDEAIEREQQRGDRGKRKNPFRHLFARFIEF